MSDQKQSMPPLQGRKLTDVLFRFSDEPSETWTLGDSFKNTLIVGATGVSKSTGSGTYIANALLKNGFSGLVLCAKPGEAEFFSSLVRKAGRENDLIIFNEGCKWQFNPLQYESARKGRGAGLTYNICEIFLSVFKVGQRLSGNSAEEKEQFWLNAMRRAMSRVIDLLKLSGEELSIGNMVKILSNAPIGSEVNERLHSTKNDQSLLKWAEQDYFIYCYIAALGNSDTPQQERDFGLIKSYFLTEFANLDSKVRSTILEMFLGFCEPFLSGILNDHFAGDTNLYPELTFEGKIIILDWPIKDYLQAGLYAQVLYLIFFCQAVERRKVDERTVPVFLWIDEAQYFINETLKTFLATARSSMACTVLLTQNLPSLYSAMGGNHAKDHIDSLLGNLSTKVIHANHCPVTNQYFSGLIGQDFVAVENAGRQYSDFSLSNSKSEGFNMQLVDQVLPMEFTMLKTGGAENNFETQAIAVMTGRRWANGKNYRKVTFTQSFT